MAKDSKFDGSKIMKGLELDDAYVGHYKKSHTYDMDYKISYVEYSIINNIFDKPFTALITGCGTAGYLSLLSNAKKVTGIDLSQKMIDAAREINKDKNLNLEFIKDDVRTFPSHGKDSYDFIEVGMLGSYIPFDIKLIQKYFDMLEAGGVLLIKSAVILVKGFSGRQNAYLFRIYYPFLRLVYDLYYRLLRREEKATTTVNRVNRKMSLFLKRNKNAELLMKSIIQKLNEPVVNYYIFIRKNLNN